MLFSNSKEKSVHAIAVVAAIVPLTAAFMLGAVFMLDFIA